MLAELCGLTNCCGDPLTVLGAVGARSCDQRMITWLRTPRITTESHTYLSLLDWYCATQGGATPVDSENALLGMRSTLAPSALFSTQVQSVKATLTLQQAA